MNRRHFIGTIGIASILPLASCSTRTGSTQKPRYIFLMIGDGMGVAQRQIAERYARMKYPSRTDGLIMNHLPLKTLTETNAINEEVTDSAAAGTALSTGTKTLNGLLCLADDKTTPLQPVSFNALDAGMRVGIVTSVPIDHATPAAFYAQVPHRSMYYEIDEQLARSGIHYFAGEPMLGYQKANQKPPPDQLIKAGGYRLIKKRDEFDRLKSGDSKIVVESELGYALEGAPGISLADFTRKGIELLDGEQGFFMMVEGGKIDWAGHANDLASNIKETLAFNEAVEVAYAFYRQHPQETLIIVTADHETGGLKLAPEAPRSFISTIDSQRFQSAHYATEMDNWKKGGSVTPDVACERLLSHFSFPSLSPEKSTHLRDMVTQTMTAGKTDTRSDELKKLYDKNNMAVLACLHEVAARSGATWTAYIHTDTRIETRMVGNGAEKFTHTRHLADIGKTLKSLISAESRHSAERLN